MVFYKSFIYFLVLVLSTVWIAVFSVNSNLHIIACDVGQGDAILIQKASTQVLIDSGPNSRVLDCLGKYMPFWDKTIELSILTHTDSDHSAGFVDVFKSYKVSNFLTNDLEKPVFSSSHTDVLKKVVGGSGTRVIHPSDTLVLSMGMIYLDVLHPAESFESSKTNDYSIVNILRYGSFKAIFTGDIEDKISDQIAINPKIQTVNYIKIPHHGSKNGLSEKLLEVLKPSIAVISLSAKNSYGHPHKEVLDMLMKQKVKILRTDEVGDVEIVTDGIKYWPN